VSYHDHPATSATKLKAALTLTGRGYWARHVDPNRAPFRPTDAMRQGSLVDLLLTQPDSFDRVYLVTSADGRTKEGKAIRAEAMAQGLELISADWLENALRIRDTLLTDLEIGPILRAALTTSQEPHFWTDALGRECRYMPDVETSTRGLWDLKKTRSAQARAVVSQSYQLAYDVQLAHYAAGFTDRHGTAPSVVGLICWEWDAPHDCGLMVATDELLAMGHERREQAFARIAEWETTDRWPSYGTSLLEPPAWRRDGQAQPDTESIELF